MKAPLGQVLDLALGTPELGTVNLRILHVLLREILSQVNLSNKEIDISEDGDVGMGHLSRSDPSSTDSGIFGDGRFETAEKDEISKSPLADVHSINIGVINQNNRFKDLEDKVVNLEDKLGFLSDVSRTDSVSKWMKEKETNASLAADMWQFNNLQRRVVGVEDGTAKLSALVDSILLEIKLFEKYRQNQESINGRVKGLEDSIQAMSGLKENAELLLKGLERLKDLENTRDELKSVSERVNILESTMMPREYMEKEFVKWDILGEALNAKRKVPEKETTSISPAGVTGSKQSTSKVMDTLGQIGALLDEQQDLIKDIEQIKETVKGKADMEDLNNLINSSAFAELDQQVKDLLISMGDIKIWRENLENDVLVQVGKSVNGLKNDVKRLEGTCKEIVDEQNRGKIHVDTLQSAVEVLEESKANKEDVVQGLEMKADKTTLDQLLSKSKFDEKIGKIDEDIIGVNKRVEDHEHSCDHTNQLLAKDVERKLDRNELDVLKEYLEKMLKAMKQRTFDEDDPAAGFRKGLLQFNCLSCNRQVCFNQNGVMQYQNGSQGNRTARPQTAGRQGQRIDGYDNVVSSLRSCGGIHTSTVPPRRITAKLNSYIYKNEEVIPLPPGRSEVDIQGQDGRYYKGRIDKRIEAFQEDSVRTDYLNRGKTKSAFCDHRPGSASPPGDEAASIRHLYSRSATSSPTRPQDI